MAIDNQKQQRLCGPFTYSDKNTQIGDVMKFLIWSQSHKAWWRAEGNGYTARRSEAGVYTVEDLERQRLDGTRWLGGDTKPPKGCDVLVVINS